MKNSRCISPILPALCRILLIFFFHTCKTDSLPKIKIDFSFFLLVSLLFITCIKQQIGTIALICGLHEWAHLAAAIICRVKVKEIRFSGFGIKMITDKCLIQPIWKDITVLLSGPAANLLLFMIFRNKVHDTAMLSLGAAVYNLLPFRQLDGGSVIELLILGSKHERAARKLLTALRFAVIALAIILTIIYLITSLSEF